MFWGRRLRKGRQLFWGTKCFRVTWLEDVLTSKWPGSFAALAASLLNLECAKLRESKAPSDNTKQKKIAPADSLTRLLISVVCVRLKLNLSLFIYILIIFSVDLRRPWGSCLPCVVIVTLYWTVRQALTEYSRTSLQRDYRMTFIHKIHRITLTSFVDNFLWSCFRRHLVGQLNRQSTQFSKSPKDTCRYLATYVSQYIAVCQRLAINKLLSSDYKLHSAVPYNLATIDTTIDRVEFCDVTAPYVPWCRKLYGRYGGRHTNLKFGMAPPYQSAEIWAIDFQENH